VDLDDDGAAALLVARHRRAVHLVWPIAVLLLKPRHALLACGLMVVGSLLLRLQLVTGPTP